jgi:hypothetical protein
MRPSSAKAKGRRLQQGVAARLLRAFPQLDETDVRSLGMGQHGEDIQLSTLARECMEGFSFECKNQERLNIFSALEQCVANAGAHEPAVVFHKNRSDTFVALRFEKFVQLISRSERQERRPHLLREALHTARRLESLLQSALPGPTDECEAATSQPLSSETSVVKPTTDRNAPTDALADHL